MLDVVLVAANYAGLFLLGPTSSLSEKSAIGADFPLVFLGGKPLPGERFRLAAHRKLFEETGILVKKTSRFKLVAEWQDCHWKTDRSRHYHLYAVRLNAAEYVDAPQPKNSELRGLAWYHLRNLPWELTPPGTRVHTEEPLNRFLKETRHQRPFDL